MFGDKVFSKMPRDIFNIICGFLTEEIDLVSLSRVCKSFNTFYSEFLGFKPYIGGIKTSIKEVGYEIPHSANLYRGINNIELEKKLANDLLDYQQIKSQLNYANMKYSPELKEETRTLINKHISLFEQNLDIPASKKSAVATLSFIYKEFEQLNSIKKNRSTSKLTNPVYLRIYLDLLLLHSLMPAIHDDEENYYKKIILTASILIRLGDMTAFFCIIELYKKFQQLQLVDLQNEIDDLLKKTRYEKTNHSSGELLNDTSILVDLRIFALRVLKIWDLDLEKFPIEMTQNFVAKFDFLSFYFYPHTTAAFLQKYFTNKTEAKLQKFLKIPSKLYYLFSNDPEHIIYHKVFNDDLDNNLAIINEQERINGISYVIETLTGVSKNNALFAKLSLNEILKIPQEITFLLPQNFKSGLKQSWNYENLCKMKSKLDKFVWIRDFEKDWTIEEIMLLMADVNENIFEIIKYCEHKEIFFSNLKSVDDLCKLAAYVIDKDKPTVNKKLLELLASKGSKQLCLFILEGATNAQTVIEKIQNNALLRKFLTIKNVDLILTYFPVYYHVLLQNRSPQVDNLDLLKDLAEDPKRFLLAQKLYGLELLSILNNEESDEIPIIKLFFNPIIVDYITVQNLNIDTIKQNYFLFFSLNDLLKIHHQSIAFLPFDKLLQFSKTDLLIYLLQINSQTLFAWTLFNTTNEDEIRKSCEVKQNNLMETEFSSEKFTRAEQQIIALFNSGIISALQRFGYHSKKNFKYCDYILLNIFNTDLITKLNTYSCSNNQTLLQKICSLNPALLLCALYNHDISEETLQYLSEFYNQAELEYMAVSQHAWLIMLYFENKLISSLSEIQLNNISALNFLLLASNKSLLIALIKAASSNSPVEINLGPLMEQGIPAYFIVDTEKFLAIFTLLQTTQLLTRAEKCALFLNSYPLEDLIYLSQVEISSSKFKNMFELMAGVIMMYGDFNRFFSCYPSTTAILEKGEVLLQELSTKKNLSALVANWTKEQILGQELQSRDEPTHKRKKSVSPNDFDEFEGEKKSFKKEKHEPTLKRKKTFSADDFDEVQEDENSRKKTRYER